MEMSNKPPITCFNAQECIYDPKICQLYETRTEVCLFEHFKNWMKEVTPQRYQAGKPVEIEVPPPEKVATPTTPTTPFNTTGKPVEKPTPKVGAVVGRVMGVPATREAKTKTGPKRVDKFNIESNGESVSITLWERPDLAQLINSGDEVTLEGLMEGEPYNGQRQFNGGNRTTLVGANVAGIDVPQQTKIANPNAPASEKQINLLNKMGVKNISPSITKQQASDLISSRMKK